VPDEQIEGTGDPQGSSAEVKESSGSQPAARAAEGGTDWKAQLEAAEAKAAALEKQLAKATGRAGSEKSTLQEQLAAEKQRADAAEAKAAAADRRRQEAEVLEAVLAKAPSGNRGLTRLAAMGILPSLADLADPSKAAEAVIAKIAEATPEQEREPVKHMPHMPNGQGQRTGLAFSQGGKRLV